MGIDIIINLLITREKMTNDNDEYRCWYELITRWE
jgi:hypothetical protein